MAQVTDPTPSSAKQDGFLGPCPASASDLRGLLTALRPLGDTSALSRHAAHCKTCFHRLCDLFLATAPEGSDPIHRLVDGLNHALYRLAKALLGAAPESGTDEFCFDRSPTSVDETTGEAEDRLDALDEYTEGRAARMGDSGPLKGLITEARDAPARAADLAESFLKRSVAIGGRHGLDAANLLGFLRYRRGDLDGAELLFRTVIERQAYDCYERETQAHAMNNLTGVHLGRGDVKSAILWCERSLMLKERLGLDARSNYLNLLFFWLEMNTAYGLERTRHYLRMLLLLDDGRGYLERALESPSYTTAVAAFRRTGLAKEFPEVELPPDRRQAQLGLREVEVRKM